MFSVDGLPPDAIELDAYLNLIAPIAPTLAGVHLYSLARPSLQKEAPRLGRLDAAYLDTVADRIRSLGLTVTVSP
jgi:hypothetical protein